LVQDVTAMVQLQVAMKLSQSKNELSLPSNFPEEWIVQDKTSTAVIPDLQLEVTTSKLQKNVSKSLNEIGFDHMMEYIISMRDLAGMYSINIPRKDVDIFSIDIANIKQKIAIEVDGPSHYLLSIDNNILMKHGQNAKAINTYEVNGWTMLKRCLLALMGWKVLVVPYWEWYAVQGTKHKEKQYCINLLQQNCITA
jgi:RAP domain